LITRAVDAGPKRYSVQRKMAVDEVHRRVCYVRSTSTPAIPSALNSGQSPVAWRTGRIEPKQPVGWWGGVALRGRTGLSYPNTYLALAAASPFNASSDGPCSKFQVTRPPIGRRAEPGNTVSGIVRNIPRKRAFRLLSVRVFNGSETTALAERPPR
jgi:hypothetical protein